MKITITATRLDEDTSHHETKLEVFYRGDGDTVNFELEGKSYFCERKELILLLHALSAKDMENAAYMGRMISSQQRLIPVLTNY